MGIDASRVYTVAEAAKVLRTDREQIYAYIRTGELPAFHLQRNSRKNLIYGADILALVTNLKEQTAGA